MVNVDYSVYFVHAWKFEKLFEQIKREIIWKLVNQIYLIYQWFFK